jgi:SAM-dependent methyltransferase
MAEDTNIGYWERVLQAPTPAYQALFSAEHDYLVETIPSGAKVLDVGCGEGRNMKSILEVTPNVSGVDNDPKAIEDSKSNFQNHTAVEVFQGEAANLPFPANTFDVVTFLMILPNLDKDKAVALKEARRVLKDDGFVILSTFSETALDERMKVYKQFHIPVEDTENGRLILGGKVVSEQFSLEDLRRLSLESRLQITDYIKINSLAYICKLVKF